jgi:hypothetical protein
VLFCACPFLLQLQTRGWVVDVFDVFDVFDVRFLYSSISGIRIPQRVAGLLMQKELNYYAQVLSLLSLLPIVVVYMFTIIVYMYSIITYLYI